MNVDSYRKKISYKNANKNQKEKVRNTEREAAIIVKIIYSQVSLYIIECGFYNDGFRDFFINTNFKSDYQNEI